MFNGAVVAAFKTIALLLLQSIILKICTFKMLS